MGLREAVVSCFSTEKKFLQKKKKKSMVFLYWSDDRGDVATHGVWVTSRVGDSSFASSCLYGTQTLGPFRSEL